MSLECCCWQDGRPDGLRQVVYWIAAELSVAIRTRVVSCSEVMAAHLDHIKAINPVVNAIVSLRPRAELLAETREEDMRLSRGEYDGWMHGFPHAVKSLADTKSLPTTYGLLPASTQPQ